MQRILIDATQVVVGGGIQVALALLGHAANCTDFEFHAAVSAEVDSQITQRERGALSSHHALPLQSSSLMRILTIHRRLSEIANRLKPDLVFSVFGPAYWKYSGPHIMGFALPKLIYPVEEYLPDAPPWTHVAAKAINAIKGNSLSRADAWVGETETVRQRMHKHLGFPLDRIAVVRNGYSQSFARALRALPPNPSDHVWTVLVPAAFYPHKDLMRIPAIARALLDAGQREFVFRMTLPESSLGWQAISEHARRIGVSNTISNYGPIPHAEFANLYRSSHCVLLPTLLECSTAVYPETFLSGLPLVTTDLDFAHELCGEGALYFTPRSALDAARALIEVRNSKIVRDRLISGGQKALKQNYLEPEAKFKAQLHCIRRFL